MTTAYAPAPASEKQINYLTSLFGQVIDLQKTLFDYDDNGPEALAATQEYQQDVLENLTKRDASDEIESAVNSVRLYKELIREKGKKVAGEIEPGIYRVGEDVYKVQLSQQGHPYAKKLVLHGTEDSDGEEYEGKFEYAPGAMKLIHEEDRISLAQAAEFGRNFVCCINCGRRLTNKVSKAAGIGPICGGRI